MRLLRLGFALRIALEGVLAWRALRPAPGRRRLIERGWGVALDKWRSLVGSLLPPLIGVLPRIRVEEQAAIAAPGGDHRWYTRWIWRLLPGLG